MTGIVEKGACGEAEKEDTIQRLLGSFEENTLPYLQYPSFPEKLVRHQWEKMAEELTDKEVDWA
jgi:hypothetical protein